MEIIIGKELAGLTIKKVLFDRLKFSRAAITSLKTVSDTSLMVGVVGLFAFIGLLIGLSLIMHGLTYNRIAKLHNQIKRRL